MMSKSNDSHEFMEEIDQVEYEQILDFYSNGLDSVEISKATGISEETIDRLLLSLGAKFY